MAPSSNGSFSFFFPSEFADSQNRLQIWNLKFWGSILTTEMESPLEDYADGLGFHFDGYFIWHLLRRRVGDAQSISNGKAPFGVPKVINGNSNSILEHQMESIVFYHSNHSLQIEYLF